MTLVRSGIGMALGAVACAGLILMAFRRRRTSTRRDQPERWRIEAQRSSLTDNVDDASLVLRLGMAVNGMRAAQRFYLAVKDSDGPAGERDRFWSFLLAVGYLHEALDLIRPVFPRVRDLAREGGATEQGIGVVASLMSGRVPFARAVRTLRNTLIFHWDAEPVRAFIERYVRDTVPWADGIGDTQGEVIYRTAADAISNSLLPDEPAFADAPDGNVRRIGELMRDVAQTTGKITYLFDHAILGHLRRHRPRKRSIS